MTLQSIPSPDLGAISVGLPTLQLLEAVDFSDDGLLLLVKAIYTDAADGGATQHLGFWLFDRASGAYVQNLTAQWQASYAFVPGMALVGASIVGDSDDYQVLVKASTSGLESTDRLVAFDASGVSIPDVLADLLGPDVAPRIERFAASPDGRFLALQTDDPNLWPVGEVDTNEVSDILLIDRLTSQITRVSKVGGAEVTGYVQLGSIAVNHGRLEVAFVTPSAFVSSDGNGSALVEADRLDAYLWSSAFDATGLTGAASFTLLSRRVGSTAAAGGVSREHPVLVTEAGVYFTGLAPDLVDGDANDAPDVFLTSRLGAVERIGLVGTLELATGSTLLDADSTGQRIALLTDAAPASSIEGLYQAVIVDRLSGQWQLASQTATGMEADDIVIGGALSPASNALAFTSAAPNLTGFDPVAQQGSLFLASFNQAPTLVNAIADQTAAEDAAFSFTVPGNAFADVDPSDTLTYSATLANGSELPTWLNFDADTRTLSGTPSGFDVGSLSIKITATDSSSAAVSDTFTLNVNNTNDAPTGGVSIGVNNGHSTADLAQGDVLTAANTLADADGLGVITYTWKAGETVLGTGASFTLTQAEVGKAITLTASYTDGYGAAESVTSAATEAVANVDDEAAGSLAVSGTMAEGNTLTASLSGVSDLDGATTTAYRWQQRAGAGTPADPFVWSDIAGATQASFSIPADQSLVGASIRVVATTTDVLGGTSEFIGNDLIVDRAPSNITISGHVYHWKTHALLSDTVVAVEAGAASASSDSSGRYTLDLGASDPVSLEVSRPVGDGIANSGITSADALAALRIAVGLNPNPVVDGVRAPISPYQIIAADVNNSGTVTSADALAILRMAVKLSTATPQQWLFVEETRDFWDEAAGQSTLTRSAASWDRSIQVDSTHQADVNLIGVLKGDVNGSWAAPEGTPDLDITDPTYFQDLAALIGVPENYWG